MSAGTEILEFLAPDNTVLGQLTKYSEFEAKRVQYGMGVLTMTLHFEEELIHESVDVDGSPTTAYLHGFANFGIRVKYNDGQEFLDTIIVAADDDDAESSESRGEFPIDIQITARSVPEVTLARREIKSSSGAANVYPSAKPDDTLKELWRDQVLASGEHPSWYSTESLGREDFGPDLVMAVAADAGAHADTDPRAYWDTGEPLLGSTMEYCRRWDMRPIATRGASGAITLGVTVPNTGTDRTTGSGKVVFDRQGGGLKRAKRLIDWETPGSVADVQGRGKGDRQPHGYAKNTALLAKIGVAETGELFASAGADDVDGHADYVLNSLQGIAVRYEFELTEGEGARWGTNWDVNDKIVIHDSRRAVTVSEYVVEATLSRKVPEPCEMAIKVGELDRSENQQSQRSGGGGGGGGKKGGKPKQKAGEALAWDSMEGSDGSTIEADENQDTIDWIDESAGNILYVESGASSDPTGDGQDEVWILRARARFFDICPSCNGYIQIKKPNGNIIYLLAYDPEGGGGGGGGGE